MQPTDYTRWYSTSVTGQGTCFYLGSITYGQSKDFLIPLWAETPNNCKFTVTYDTAQMKNKRIEFEVKISSQQADLDIINRQQFRLKFVHCVRTAFEKLSETNTTEQHQAAMNQIKELEENMRTYADGNDEYVKDLLADLTGQVQQAIEKQDWFKKWGRHFLPSLTRKFGSK
jgi:hypothetical protein